jgi:hypothetical protein
VYDKKYMESIEELFYLLVALKRAVGLGFLRPDSKCGGLLGAGVLGDGLGALRHGVLGELARQDQADGGLHFAAGDGALLVVLGQTGSFGGDALEDVVHERVHDRHGLGADAGVRVNLLEHSVDVHRVRLLSSSSLFLVPGAGRLLRLGGLLGSLGAGLGRHG